MKKAQRGFLLGLCIIAAVLMLTTGCAHQQGAKDKVKLTGAELEKRGAERAVFSGYNPKNGCAAITAYFDKGNVRQTWDCFTASGSSWGKYIVEGDTICTTWDDPRVPAGCVEVYKIGEAKYESWRDGQPLFTFYSLK
jgi:hypothetical protein